MNSNRIMLTAIVAATFVSACSSTSTLVYDCQKEDECERQAEQRCKTKNFRVSERAKYEEAKQRPLSDRTGASDISGALGQGTGGSRRYATDDIETRPQWRYTVECNPKTPASKWVESTTTIYPELSAEQLAKREEYKKMYMHEVCELMDPDLRREELEMARREFGDVSCPD